MKIKIQNWILTKIIMYKLTFLTLGLFRFSATNVTLRKQWIRKITRENFIPSSYFFNFYEHFLPTDYTKISKRP